MMGGRGATIVFLDVYEDRFVRRCHELLGMGHRRLNPKSLASLDETAITGRLVEAMEAARDDPNRPDWAAHFTTLDDPPVNVTGKTGKRRPRIDVLVRCINPDISPV